MEEGYLFNPNPQRVKGLNYSLLVTACVTSDWFLILEKNLLTEDLMKHPRLLWILDEVSEKFLKETYPATFINLTYSLELKDPKEFKKATAVVFYGKLKNVFEFAKTYAIREFSLMITKDNYNRDKHKEAFPLNSRSFKNYFQRIMVTDQQNDGYHLETYYPRMMTVVQENAEKAATEEIERAEKEAAEKAEEEAREKAELQAKRIAESEARARERIAERARELAELEREELVVESSK